MLNTERPQWLDKVQARTIAVLRLDDGECLTADILEFNDERYELIVDVVSSNRPYQTGLQGRAIPVINVVSCEPRSRAEQPWPYSDPCRGAPFSFGRFFLMATLFLSMIVGGFTLFVVLAEKPFGVQEASMIVYTIFVVLYTFSATKV
jgi:hypothetical protein